MLVNRNRTLHPLNWRILALSYIGESRQQKQKSYEIKQRIQILVRLSRHSDLINTFLEHYALHLAASVGHISIAGSWRILVVQGHE